QHGAPHDHGERLLLLVQVATDLDAQAAQDVDVELAVSIPRRADADHGQIGVGDALGAGGGGLEPAALDGLSQQDIEARFHNRRHAGVDHGHLLGVHVHADDLMASLRETRRAHAADVAESEYADTHGMHSPAVYSVVGAERRFEGSLEPGRCRLSTCRLAEGAELPGYLRPGITLVSEA